MSYQAAFILKGNEPMSWDFDPEQGIDVCTIWTADRYKEAGFQVMDETDKSFYVVRN